MAQESVLDLIGEISPICLMKIKHQLLGMQRGEKLQILIRDTEVVNNLKIIIDRSSDEIIDSVKEQNHLRIMIRKG